MEMAKYEVIRERCSELYRPFIGCCVKFVKGIQRSKDVSMGNKEGFIFNGNKIDNLSTDFQFYLFGKGFLKAFNNNGVVIVGTSLLMYVLFVYAGMIICC
ncbi:MAG: hypothetical protein KatS3mg087_0047 [Patescibacteria group bacterium]|nr:MAG: hypothetical protein KatS3mg087_0047 [Patescibacteria group bacterium]